MTRNLDRGDIDIMINFKGTMTAKDYRDYIKTYMMYSKITYIFMIGAVLTWSLLDLYVNIRAGAPFDKILLITFIAMILISIVIVCVVMYLQYIFSARQLIKNRKVDGQLEECAYHIDSVGLKIDSSLITAEYKWESIKYIRKKNDTYYLFINANEAIIIPNRFLTESDLEELETLISKIIQK